MNKVFIPCRRSNYGGLRAGTVQYIVIHYTAGDGDTAHGNGLYFSRNDVGTSAHWFVDELGAVSSVPETHVAWHCGAPMYVNPECRNGNSIGVEICSRKDTDGVYYFEAAAVENAAALVRELMEKYGVPEERVVRHYDVTGKICPAPFVGAGTAEWEKFKEVIAVKRYNTLDEIPAWAKATIEKLLNKDILQGNGSGLDLSYDMVRMLVVLDRTGVFN